jgi:outer membrane lipoprotein SlyB
LIIRSYVPRAIGIEFAIIFNDLMFDQFIKPTNISGTCYLGELSGRGNQKVKVKIWVLGLLLATGCATVQPTTPRTYKGAAVGAVLGGLTGAILDHNNPWRGGVIGGAIGAVAGGTITEISERASREAAEENQPVEYQTEDGRGVYRAQPRGYDPHTKCHTIYERVWEDGRLVRDRIKEICEKNHDPTPPPVVVEERTVYISPPPSEPSPPPWAPAHGYRARHRYYYYPSSGVYFDAVRGLYFYSQDDIWHVSISLPRGVYIQKTEYIVLEMNTEKPYLFHSEIYKRYPPGYSKKSHKRKKRRKYD